MDSPGSIVGSLEGSRERIPAGDSSSASCWAPRLSISAKDPENKLWWRFNRRRLLAEEIRDSILDIDGTLEHGMQQQLMPHKPREYVTSGGFKNVDFQKPCIHWVCIYY